MGRGRRMGHAQLAELLREKWRAKSFDDLLRNIPWLVCGQYKCEAKGLWDTLHDLNIESMVEIGRNLGGGLFLFASILPDLKKVLSIDQKSWRLTDNVFPSYFNYFGIEHEILTLDSTTYEPYEFFWDFVYIDGGHELEIIKKDIEIWRDKTKYIGFHDFSDMGKGNKHRRRYSGVVKSVLEAEEKYGWTRIGNRGRSEIVFKT